jgi:hypothetical protein
LALALAALPAHAAPSPVPKTASFAWSGGQLRMSVAYREVLDGPLQGKVLSGLPTTVVLRAYVFEENGTAPIALSVKTCKVTYDLWNEVFKVELNQTGAPPRVDPAVVNLNGVLGRCAEARDLMLAQPGQLRTGGRYVINALVEVNPVSPEMLERIRRWVSRPAGTTRIGAGDALFGSFAGLFVARMQSADRELAFRTQPLVAPPPPPPSP